MFLLFELAECHSDRDDWWSSRWSWCAPSHRPAVHSCGWVTTIVHVQGHGIQRASALFAYVPAPASVWLSGATNEFDTTRSLEATARLLGARSLDTLARLFGHDRRP